MSLQPNPSSVHQNADASLAQYSLNDLDERAERAERLMNEAMDQDRWPAASHHRSQMRAVEAELHRRVADLDDRLRRTPQYAG